MRTTHRLAIAFAALLFMHRAVAWGAEAHRTIGLIAEQRLNPTARAHVRDLLGANIKSYYSLVQLHGARWMFNSRLETAGWLSLHVPQNSTEIDFERECAAPHHCIVWAIRHCRDIVADPKRTANEREAAMAILVILICDIHNPLSVSFATDDGGRETHLEYFGKCTDLRSIWDEEIFRRARRQPQHLATELIDHLPNATVLEWQRELSPEAWADESFELTRHAVYFGIPSSGELWQPYQKRNWPIVQERLAAAGVRLAAVLNSIFAEDLAGR